MSVHLRGGGHFLALMLFGLLAAHSQTTPVISAPVYRFVDSLTGPTTSIEVSTPVPTSPDLVEGTVTLLEVTADGQVISTVGQMTRKLNRYVFNMPPGPPGRRFFCVQASFNGVNQPVYSDVSEMPGVPEAPTAPSAQSVSSPPSAQDVTDFASVFQHQLELQKQALDVYDATLQKTGDPMAAGDAAQEYIRKNSTIKLPNINAATIGALLKGGGPATTAPMPASTATAPAQSPIPGFPSIASASPVPADSTIWKWLGGIALFFFAAGLVVGGFLVVLVRWCRNRTQKRQSQGRPVSR